MTKIRRYFDGAFERLRRGELPTLIDAVLPAVSTAKNGPDYKAAGPRRRNNMEITATLKRDCPKSNKFYALAGKKLNGFARPPTPVTHVWMAPGLQGLCE
jgi:hypothetical protein